MPDRKLPVVYVVVGEDGEYCFSAGSRETAETYLSMNDVPEYYSGQRESLVMYDPPIPRCRTCQWFDRNGLPVATGELYCLERIPFHGVPVDGSGYCHNHSELRNA